MDEQKLRQDFYDEIVSMKAEGRTWREIGLHFGLNANTVRKRWERIRDSQKEDPYGISPEELEGFFEHGNKATVVGRVHSIGDLLSIFDVDEDEWLITNAVVETWEMGRKKETRRIIYGADGKIQEGSFSVDTGEVNPQTLFKCKAWLVRKMPILIRPMIQPINLNFKLEYSPKPPRSGALCVALVLGDMQIGYERDLDTGYLNPYHDRIAMDVALQIARSYPFTDLIINGDYMDFSEWQDRFARSPEHNQTTGASLREGCWWLGMYAKACVNARRRYVQGNHEIRIPNYIDKMIPAAHDLRNGFDWEVPPALSVPGLLALDTLGYEWIDGYPDNRIWLNDGVVVEHGNKVSGVPGGTARKMAEKDYSTVFNHIHRAEKASRLLEQRNGIKQVQAVSAGCLCRIDGTVPGSTKESNWQHGVSVVYYDPESKHHAIEIIEIRDGLAVWGGEVFEGQDNSEQIAEEIEIRGIV